MRKYAKHLVSRKIRGLGIDTLSPDNGNGWPVHKILLEAGIFIIENIIYKDSLGPQGFLQVVPLNIEGSTESPLRLFFIQQ